MNKLALVSCILQIGLMFAWAGDETSAADPGDYTNSQNASQPQAPTQPSSPVGGGAYVHSGGLHGTGVSCTADPIRLEASTAAGQRISADGAEGPVVIDYGAAGIAANCARPGSDVCWVVGSIEGPDRTGTAGATGVSVPAVQASDFHRVGDSSVYVDCRSTSQPAFSGESVSLMKVTIRDGAITAVDDLRRPESFVQSGVYDITDPLYGAVADGVSDARGALQAAVRAAPDGVSVWVPAGQFGLSANVWVDRSNFTLSGTGAASILKARTGFINTANKGLVSVGYTGTESSSVFDITIRDITLDGNSLVKSLDLLRVSTGLVAGVSALNAGPSGGAIYARDTTDLVVEGNLVAGAIGKFGDGIYCGGCIRPRIVDNAVSNFARIGIVTEAGDRTTKSREVYIAGNVIGPGGNATGGQSNTGIWNENTCGVVVTGNRIADMTNSPGTQKSQGLQAARGSGGGCRFSYTANQVSGAQWGMRIAADPSDIVVVDDLSIARGTLANYSIGIAINQASDIDISRLTLGSNDFDVPGRSGIVVDTTAAARLHRFTVQDSAVDPGSRYTANTATLLVFHLGAGGDSMTLRNLQGWRILMGSAPARLEIENCDLSYRSDSSFDANYAIQATSLVMSDSTLSRAPGAGGNEKAFNLTSASSYTFRHVHFVDLPAWAVIAAASHGVTCDECVFTVGKR